LLASQLREVCGDSGAVAGDERGFHFALLLKGEGQPLDLLALHVALSWISSSVPPRKQIFLPARSSEVATQDGWGKPQAGIGGITPPERTKIQRRKLA
jgi:hypothetical protein